VGISSDKRQQFRLHVARLSGFNRLASADYWESRSDGGQEQPKGEPVFRAGNGAKLRVAESVVAGPDFRSEVTIPFIQDIKPRQAVIFFIAQPSSNGSPRLGQFEYRLASRDVLAKMRP
jgi:hypothetical protein